MPYGKGNRHNTINLLILKLKPESIYYLLYVLQHKFVSQKYNEIYLLTYFLSEWEEICEAWKSFFW